MTFETHIEHLLRLGVTRADTDAIRDMPAVDERHLPGLEIALRWACEQRIVDANDGTTIVLETNVNRIATRLEMALRVARMAQESSLD